MPGSNSKKLKEDINRWLALHAVTIEKDIVQDMIDGLLLYKLINIIQPDSLSLPVKGKSANLQKAIKVANKKNFIPDVFAAEDFESNKVDETAILVFIGYFKKLAPKTECVGRAGSPKRRISRSSQDTSLTPRTSVNPLTPRKNTSSGPPPLKPVPPLSPHGQEENIPPTEPNSRYHETPKGTPRSPENINGNIKKEIPSLGISEKTEIPGLQVTNLGKTDDMTSPSRTTPPNALTSLSGSRSTPNDTLTSVSPMGSRSTLLDATTSATLRSSSSDTVTTGTTTSTGTRSTPPVDPKRTTVTCASTTTPRETRSSRSSSTSGKIPVALSMETRTSRSSSTSGKYQTLGIRRSHSTHTRGELEKNPVSTLRGNPTVSFMSPTCSEEVPSPRNFTTLKETKGLCDHTGKTGGDDLASAGGTSVDKLPLLALFAESLSFPVLPELPELPKVPESCDRSNTKSRNDLALPELPEVPESCDRSDTKSRNDLELSEVPESCDRSDTKSRNEIRRTQSGGKSEQKINKPPREVHRVRSGGNRSTSVKSIITSEMFTLGGPESNVLRPGIPISMKIIWEKRKPKKELEFSVQVLDPREKNIPARIKEIEGRYQVEFTPLAVETYRVEVKLDGKSIMGSPTNINIPDSTLKKKSISPVSIIGNPKGFTGKRVVFETTPVVGVAGEPLYFVGADYIVEVHVPHHPQPKEGVARVLPSGGLEITFFTSDPGNYYVQIFIGDTPLLLSPCKVPVKSEREVKLEQEKNELLSLVSSAVKEREKKKENTKPDSGWNYPYDDLQRDIEDMHGVPHMTLSPELVRARIKEEEFQGIDLSKFEGLSQQAEKMSSTSKIFHFPQKTTFREKNFSQNSPMTYSYKPLPTYPTHSLETDTFKKSGSPRQEGMDFGGFRATVNNTDSPTLDQSISRARTNSLREPKFGHIENFKIPKRAKSVKNLRESVQENSFLENTNIPKNSDITRGTLRVPNQPRQYFTQNFSGDHIISPRENFFPSTSSAPSLPHPHRPTTRVPTMDSRQVPHHRPMTRTPTHDARSLRPITAYSDPIPRQGLYHHSSTSLSSLPPLEPSSLRSSSRDPSPRTSSPHFISSPRVAESSRSPRTELSENLYSEESTEHVSNSNSAEIYNKKVKGLVRDLSRIHTMAPPQNCICVDSQDFVDQLSGGVRKFAQLLKEDYVGMVPSPVVVKYNFTLEIYKTFYSLIMVMEANIDHLITDVHLKTKMMYDLSKLSLNGIQLLQIMRTAIKHVTKAHDQFPLYSQTMNETKTLLVEILRGLKAYRSDVAVKGWVGSM